MLKAERTQMKTKHTDCFKQRGRKEKKKKKNNNSSNGINNNND